MSIKIEIFFGVLFLCCLVLAFFNVNNFRENFFESTNFGEISEQQDSNEANDLLVINTSSQKREINFVGDIMLGRDVERHIVSNGLNYPFAKINFNDEISYSVGNFESALPEKHIPTPNNTFRFSVNEYFLPSLRAAGFTHLSVSNNHTFDYGLAGFNNLVTKLWDNDLIPFGHPSILSTSSVAVVTVDNIKIAIIGVHTLYNPPTKRNIEEVLAFASSISDMQVVYIHWGEEYNEKQSKSQRDLAKLFADAGVEIIIGHHPHVVQGIEKIGKALVFYSLGNYIFDQYFSSAVQNGLVLTISFTDFPKVMLTPVTSQNSKAQPQKMDDQMSLSFLSSLAQRSDDNLKSAVVSGTVPFDFTLATSSEVVIMTE